MSALSRPATVTRGERAQVAGLSRTRLAWLQATRRRGWAVGLWLCLAAALTLPVLLPVVEATAVRAALAETLTLDSGYTVQQSVTDVDAFDGFARDMDATVAAHLGSRLIPLTAYARTGPLSVTTVNTTAAPGNVAGRPLTATYFDHLASHVVVVAGLLPPEGLSGGETAVTMDQAGADQLGLRLSDRFCANLATNGPAWCGRLVGLWEPQDAHEAFWAGRPPSLDLVMGRYDLFQLARLLPQPPTVGTRFGANPAAIDPGQAAATAQAVRQLTAGLTTANRHVTTSLDRSLDTFDQGRAATAAAIRPFLGVLMLLAATVVVLVAARFLEGQASGLAILRARGWPSARVWRVAFAGMGALGLWAIPLGLGTCALAAAVLTLAGWGPSPLILGVQDVRGVAVAEGVTAVALLAVLAVLAGLAARWEIDPTLEAPYRQPLPVWLRGATIIGMAAVGLPALFLPHLVGASLRQAITPDGAALLPLASAAGAGLLTAAGVRLRAFLTRPPRPSAGVARSLAGWQLHRAPDQHTWPSYALALAAAAAAFSAVGLSAVLSGSLPTAQPSLVHGMEGTLLTGTLVGSALALIGYGLHFRATTRWRLREYAGLLAQGLDVRALTSSLATEEATTATTGLPIGAIMGVVLAVVVLPLPPPTTVVVQLAVLLLAGAAGCLGVGVAIVGLMARRLRPEPDLLRRR